MKSREKDLVRLHHMLEAVELILEFCEGRNYAEFEDDKFFQSAIVRQFEVLGEASMNVSGDLKSKFPDIEWEQMRRFRNFLIHEYFRIDSAQVWTTIQNDLPLVRIQLENILNNFTE